MALYLIKGNDNLIELVGLANDLTNEIDVGATVTATVTDRSGNELIGQSWPVTLSYVEPTSNNDVEAGTYRATLDSTIVVSIGDMVTATIDVTGSGGEVGQWVSKVKVINRGGC